MPRNICWFARQHLARLLQMEPHIFAMLCRTSNKQFSKCHVFTTYRQTDDRPNLGPNFAVWTLARVPVLISAHYGMDLFYFLTHLCPNWPAQLGTQVSFFCISKRGIHEGPKFEKTITFPLIRLYNGLRLMGPEEVRPKTGLNRVGNKNVNAIKTCGLV